MHVSKRKTTKTVHSSFQHRVFLYVPSCTHRTHVQGVCECECECVMVNTHMTPGLGLHVAIVYTNMYYTYSSIPILVLRS